MTLTLLSFSAVKSVPASSAVLRNSSSAACSVTERILTHDGSCFAVVRYCHDICCQLECFNLVTLNFLQHLGLNFNTYLFAARSTALDSLVVTSSHIRTFAFAEAIIHQAVAEPDGVFGLCENHCACDSVSSNCTGGLISPEM